jgi:hypothetical protein
VLERSGDASNGHGSQINLAEKKYKMIFEGVFQPPSSLVCLARYQVEAFNNVTRRLSDPSNKERDTVDNLWEKPRHGSAKIN